MEDGFSEENVSKLVPNLGDVFDIYKLYIFDFMFIEIFLFKGNSFFIE